MPIETYRRMKRELAFITFCFGMVILTLVLVGLMLMDNKNATLKNREVGKINQLYTRVTACLASVTPIQRTAPYVKSCYDRAEAETGVKATRYGDGAN